MIAVAMPVPAQSGPPIKLRPFVTDTLFPLVGGPFRIEQRSPFQAPVVNGYRLDAATFAGPRDTVVAFWTRPYDHVLAHEAGHMLDFRRFAALVLAAVDLGRERYAHPSDYFGASREEYVAEAFARAVECGRRRFADSTAVDHDFPGTIELIRWLRSRAVFAAAEGTSS